MGIVSEVILIDPTTSSLDSQTEWVSGARFVPYHAAIELNDDGPQRPRNLPSEPNPFLSHGRRQPAFHLEPVAKRVESS
jgi:hypothetical protein